MATYSCGYKCKRSLERHAAECSGRGGRVQDYKARVVVSRSLPRRTWTKMQERRGSTASMKRRMAEVWGCGGHRRRAPSVQGARLVGCLATARYPLVGPARLRPFLPCPPPNSGTFSTPASKAVRVRRAFCKFSDTMLMPRAGPICRAPHRCQRDLVAQQRRGAHRQCPCPGAQVGRVAQGGEELPAPRRPRSQARSL